MTNTIKVVVTTVFIGLLVAGRFSKPIFQQPSILQAPYFMEDAGETPAFPEGFENHPAVSGSASETDMVDAVRAKTLFSEGCNYRKVKNYREAVEVFHAATNLNPQNAIYHFAYGITLCDIGQFHEGALALSKANKLGSNSVYAIFLSKIVPPPEGHAYPQKSWKDAPCYRYSDCRCDKCNRFRLEQMRSHHFACDCTLCSSVRTNLRYGGYYGGGFSGKSYKPENPSSEELTYWRTVRNDCEMLINNDLYCLDLYVLRLYLNTGCEKTVLAPNNNSGNEYRFFATGVIYANGGHHTIVKKETMGSAIGIDNNIRQWEEYLIEDELLEMVIQNLDSIINLSPENVGEYYTLRALWRFIQFHKHFLRWEVGTCLTIDDCSMSYTNDSICDAIIEDLTHAICYEGNHKDSCEEVLNEMLKSKKIWLEREKQDELDQIERPEQIELLTNEIHLDENNPELYFTRARSKEYQNIGDEQNKKFDLKKECEFRILQLTNQINTGEIDTGLYTQRAKLYFEQGQYKASEADCNIVMEKGNSTQKGFVGVLKSKIKEASEKLYLP